MITFKANVSNRKNRVAKSFIFFPFWLKIISCYWKMAWLFEIEITKCWDNNWVLNAKCTKKYIKVLFLLCVIFFSEYLNDFNKARNNWKKKRFNTFTNFFCFFMPQDIYQMYFFITRLFFSNNINSFYIIATDKSIA